jgi:nucleotide-binding universal stress UspA family protein
MHRNVRYNKDAMINRILLCVDASQYSLTAADYALLLAQKTGASVVALHVLDIRMIEGPYIADLGGALGAQPYLALFPQIQTIQKEKSELIMQALKGRFEGTSVPIECEVVSSHLVPEILEREKTADLVILGKRGEHSPENTDLLGPSVEWIVRRSVKPCLVTPWRVRAIERVLAAFDGSDHSRKAVSTALDLVKAMNLSLEIATVCPPGEVEAEWKAILDDGVALVRDSGVAVTPHLLHGHPGEEITRFCSDAEFDLLVIGAYGHTRIREFLLGSTTFQILLSAEIPVYLIR